MEHMGFHNMTCKNMGFQNEWRTKILTTRNGHGHCVGGPLSVVKIFALKFHIHYLHSLLQSSENLVSNYLVSNLHTVYHDITYYVNIISLIMILVISIITARLSLYRRLSCKSGTATPHQRDDTLDLCNAFQKELFPQKSQERNTFFCFRKCLVSTRLILFDESEFKTRLQTVRR